MFKCVIICKEQYEYIPEFETALNEIEHVYVFDRPKDLLDIPKVNCIINMEGNGFLAGRMRNLGSTIYPNDDILFLDGDKVPYGDLFKLNELPYDCILLGTKDDIRLKDFSDGKLKLPSDWHFPRNYCYSCGILYRNKLIKHFREINDGLIFNEEFSGNWGEEDSWNGDIMLAEGKWKIYYSTDVYLNGKIQGLTEDRFLTYCSNFEKRLFLRTKHLQKYEF